MFELSIETRLPCLNGFEEKQDMTSSLLAEAIGRVASVFAELFCIGRFITHMIRTAFVIYIL